MNRRALGRSGITVAPIGIGTNRWGAADVPSLGSAGAYAAARSAGADFIDTAELYNHGHSEEVVGRCVDVDATQPIIASKFAPLPTRVTNAQFTRALDETLSRLGRPVVDLYYLHFPFSVVSIRTWMDRMAEAVQMGKVRAVGISNCGVRCMHAAADALSRHGIPLAANQVHYSVFHRNPESNGVMQACRDLDVALVAYRPLAGGSLEHSEALGKVARSRNVSVAQVALNWLLQRDPRVIVIPGASSSSHAKGNTSAMTWTLTEAEHALIAC
jgi:aryl-alcohol dehydrogenase-like predicted oxidoreductase